VTTTTQKFSYAYVDYDIDVCEQHADMLQRDIMSWARLAREKERPSTFRSSDAVRAYTTSNYGSPIAKSIPTTKEEPVPTQAPALPHVARNWTLTDHAEEQLEDRGPKYGFDRTDVFLACVQPKSTIPNKTNPHRRHHLTDKVQLVVDPIDKVVVTVLAAKHLGDTRELDKELEMANATG
jgi:hypothetical protein